MTDFRLTRREFVKGCCSAALVSGAGTSLMFADDAIAAANSHDTVVHLFLRGGMDGLNLVVPVSGADRTFYEQARPDLSVAATGAYGALPLTLSTDAATGFGLHPSASGLRDLWNDGKLAIVHACGMPTTVTRSHFDAQLYIDLGTPG
ncbi:MAG TPA: twin-arginine translocation signal domain-containing protein, partial [Pseudoxanthomonas sp.]